MLQLFNKKLTRKDLDKKYNDLINQSQIFYDSSNINSIENGIFNGLNKLESINLANNEIIKIDKLFQCSIDYKLLIEINELKENHFRLNIDLKIIQNNLKNLTKIDFSNNFIETIAENTFNNLINLTKIDLSNNHLKLIENKLFNGLANLKDINLSFNQLENIGKQFQNLNNLDRIDLSNNQIRIIDESAFKGLVTLNEINLYYNDELDKNKKLILNLEQSVKLVYFHHENENNIEFIINTVKYLHL